MDDGTLQLQDYGIIVEALVAYGGNPNELNTERQKRAWELVDEIAALCGMPPGELLRVAWE